MKAISLWQPWASAMARGVKRNETRSWPTSHRGDLLICSAKRKPRPHELSGIADICYEDALAMPYGCALCVVELFDCVPTSRVLYFGTLPEAEAELGDYSAGRFAWLTRNLRQLKRPVPMRGHQGFWELAASDDSLIRSLLP